MPQPWRKILLLLLTAPILFTSCKKQFSSDNPLTPSYAPSVIINSDNQILYAINPLTGVKNWQYSLSGANMLPVTQSTPIQFQPSPLVYKGMVYIPGARQYSFVCDTLFKINSATGALVQKIFISPVPPGGYNIQATPVADANLIYLATDNDTLYAIDTTGVVKWKYGASSPIISSPVVYKGMVYCATIGGTVFALDKTQGTAANSENWTCSITGASFYSSPAISFPYLYIGSVADSNMYCIPLTPVTTGTFVTTTVSPRWSYKTQGAIYSSPAADFGVCVFGSADFNVYCLDTFLIGTEITPGARWITPTASAVRSSPVINNNVVYIGSYDYNLYALNIINGTVKWKFATNALVKSSPLVYNGLVYIGSYDKNIYAVDTALGTEMWIYNTNGQIECSPAVEDLSQINQNNSQISGFTN